VTGSETVSRGGSTCGKRFRADVRSEISFAQGTSFALESHIEPTMVVIVCFIKVQEALETGDRLLFEASGMS
jgi:hypothetical protein